MKKILHTFFFGYASYKYRRLIRTPIVLAAIGVFIALVWNTIDRYPFPDNDYVDLIYETYEDNVVKVGDKYKLYLIKHEGKRNEETIRYAYQLFKQEGYKKSLESFKLLMGANKEAFKLAYDIYVREGYAVEIDQFKSLMGVYEEESLQTPPSRKEFVQLLKDFTATAQACNYDWNVTISKFPKLQSFDLQVLKDYVATAEVDDYDYAKINAKFPELFVEDNQTVKVLTAPSAKFISPSRREFVQLLKIDNSFLDLIYAQAKRDGLTSEFGSSYWRKHELGYASFSERAGHYIPGFLIILSGFAVFGFFSYLIEPFVDKKNLEKEIIQQSLNEPISKESMYCPGCEKQIPKNSVFCIHCDNKKNILEQTSKSLIVSTKTESRNINILDKMERVKGVKNVYFNKYILKPFYYVLFFVGSAILISGLGNLFSGDYFSQGFGGISFFIGAMILFLLWKYKKVF